MKQISKPLLVGGVLAFSLVFGGCSLASSKPTTDVKVESPVVNLTGKVTVSGETVSISANGKITQIASRKVDLKKLDGQNVTVTGEFSGTTLYVDEVK